MIAVTNANRTIGRTRLRGRFTEPSAQNRVKPRQRLKAAGKLLLVLLFTSAAVAGAVVLYKSISGIRYFTVKTITVAGLHKLDERHVRGIVAPLLSGNIFTRDIERATQMLEQFPEVDTVSIRLKLPDTAEVTVVERKPASAVFVNGKLFQMDAKNVLIEEAAGPNASFLIRGLSGAGVAGERITDPRLADVERITSLFALDTKYGDRPTSVDVGNPERIEVHTAGGLFLRFGPDKELWEEKFYEYLSARDISGDMGLRFIGWDLSFRDQVVGIRGDNQPSRDGNDHRG
ncbi:MAG: FtsQ-type POTRA domain-containing protein [Nitrospinae bacterium]|nr:FtsQ-type POTRA domain-containing protein [Nitrospinota bacterium]